MTYDQLSRRTTPAPWVVSSRISGEEDSEDHAAVLETKDGSTIAHTYGLTEDLVMAAHCRNNHDALVAALRNLVVKGLIRNPDGDHMDEVIEALVNAERVDPWT